MRRHVSSSIFFFNDTATTEIYTLSLHDALPICLMAIFMQVISARLGVVTGKDLAQCCRDWYPRWTRWPNWLFCEVAIGACDLADRKSTRLNSSHQIISYAVFCLKKKNTCLTQLL